MKKLLLLLLTFSMVISLLAMLSSCSSEEGEISEKDIKLIEKAFADEENILPRMGNSSDGDYEGDFARIEYEYPDIKKLLNRDDAVKLLLWKMENDPSDLACLLFAYTKILDKITLAEVRELGRICNEKGIEFPLGDLNKLLPSAK